MNRTEFKQIIQAQDDLIAAAGVDVWVGMEPTFTRRFSESSQWLSEALGEEKLQYAYKLLNELCKRQPNGVVMHTLGRQYAGEDLPRWSIGYYQDRNKQFIWAGPPDPNHILDLENSVPSNTVNPTAKIENFWRDLKNILSESSWQTAAYTVGEEMRYRLLFRCDGAAPVVDIDHKPLLARSSVHKSKIPLNGLKDELAADGDFLLCTDTLPINSSHSSTYTVVIELPEISNVSFFWQLLQHITQAAKRNAIETLRIQGFPPPVDASVAWTTITPDPAVIEVNQAPADNAAHFYESSELSYSAARAVGLHPYRLHYNGVVSDSGGGGQFTLGGDEPLHSPFFRHPHLLPRLIRYLNAHPALSYWFAPASIGSSSQSPRTDEGVRESFRELSVALEQLENLEHPQPEFIWRSLSPFLVDPSGNPHRSELNIEKLWNPYLPGRGCLGLVEFRAFRMSPSSQCATVITVLLRSIVAMLCRIDKAPKLINHGTNLHDKYALPFYLQADLQHIFTDLHQSELSLHDSIKTLLQQDSVRFIGKSLFHGCYIELQQALEFWPLVGDVASQESGGSRLVDASTTRLQVILSVESHHPTQLDGWELWFEGYRIPLRLEQGPQGPIYITGLRYRNYLPDIGLHPGVGSRNSITLVLVHRGLNQALQITYYEWQPQGLPYSGLPEDLDDAQNRRAERFVTKIVPFQGFAQPKALPDSATTDYCLDLRRLSDSSPTV